MFSRDLRKGKVTIAVNFIVGYGEGDERVGFEDVAVLNFLLRLDCFFLE